MNAIRKFDLKAIVACVIVFGIVQGLLFGEIIGPFWELNIILICINIILAVSLNLINGYTVSSLSVMPVSWQSVLIPVLL